MSRRDLKLFLLDILDAGARVKRYVAGLSYQEFTESELLVDAVTRNLEVIGEAAKQIPPAWKAKYSDVPWRRVTGFRDIAIHAYFSVDTEILWTIITTQLDELLTTVDQMLHDAELQERGED